MSETTELAQQVADLTTSTTNLTNTVVGQVERLSADVAITDQKATEAANSAIAAEDSAVAANTHKANAKVEADRAKSEADNAASVVTGGTATLDSEAGKIPLADSDGKIDLSWLPAEAQGYNVFAQEQAVNNDTFAASGFVHFGNRYEAPNSGIRINNGMWSDLNYPNTVNVGRGSDYSYVEDSKTDFPVVNIAGIETSLEYLANSTLTRSIIKFPEAPNGTVTYDSATGAIVDYTKDVDPKYGDVAPDVNEAVARAFEGEVNNGDFRFGDDGNWVMSANAGGTYAFNNADCIIDSDGINQHRIYFRGDYRVTEDTLINTVVQATGTAGVTIEIEYFSGNGFVRESYTFVGGESVKLNILSTWEFGFNNEISVKYKPGAAGTLTIHSVLGLPVTTEVVTERVDMWGFEGYLEEVSVTNPYVYQNGLIQSQATDIDGVATGDSNRPDTYYAVFDGDTTSRGKGVNFWAISDAQRKDIFSNPDNKLYLIDGKIYQWRLRQRTIAGAGNGDFYKINSETDSLFQFSTGGGLEGKRINPQGQRDSALAYTDNNTWYAGDESLNPNKKKGIFTVSDGANVNVGAFGHCYFLVCGTVSRLNQGAYHPSFNAMGTASWSNDLVGGSSKWSYNPAGTKSYGFNLKDAFINGVGGTIGQASGRPDGRFFDAIYADGLGGVVLDMRYSAWDKSAPEHKAKALAMVENGTYRGVEKLKFTEVNIPTKVDATLLHDHITKTGAVSIAPGSNFGVYGYRLSIPIASVAASSTSIHNYTTLAGIGNKYIVYKGDNGGTFVAYGIVHMANAGTTHYFCALSSDASAERDAFNTAFPNGTVLSMYVVDSQEKNHSVGGEFQLTEVIGDPANILANPDLKDGWLGSWNPQLPTGSDVNVPFTRKFVGSPPMSANVSSDNGLTWTSPTWNTYISTVTNTLNDSGLPVGSVCLNYSTAFAKQTKPSTNQPVFNGEAGVGSVYSSCWNDARYGTLLCESLSGEVVTNSNSTGTITGKYLGTQLDLSVIDGTLPSNRLFTHTALELPAPNNNSGAFKTLTTQLSVNDQASIQFQYEELVHNGTDWGDDGKMFITATGDSTNTDENGTVVKCGVHELAVPYGWCKVEV